MTGTEAKARFQGCYTATLTPFNGNNAVAHDVITRHISWQIKQGIAGFCPSGTTGEFLFLTDDEKARVIETTTEAANGRVPVIAGVWAWEAQDRVSLTKAAKAAGTDAVFLPPPIYYPASDEAIYRWYAEVREASDLPVLAYNIPQYAANSLSLECLERLFEAEIIVGVKDSTGKADRVRALVEQFGTRGVVFAASDAFATEGRDLGADGFISAISNVAPALLSAVWNGETTRQTEVNAIRAIIKEVGSISGLKAILTAKGYAFGESRLPYSQLTLEQTEKLAAYAATVPE